MKGGEVAPGQIHRHVRQRLVHRHGGVAHALNALPVAKRVVERPAQHDRNILGGVVRVDVQVAFGLHLDVEQAVSGELRQHVIQEPNAGRAAKVAGTVDGYRRVDLGLRGGARDAGASFSHESLDWTGDSAL